MVKFPKPVLIGLGCQILLLPLACFLLAKGFQLEAALAVGMMLLAASPAVPRPTSTATWPMATWR